MTMMMMMMMMIRVARQRWAGSWVAQQASWIAALILFPKSAAT
jgi:hypothetical protein